MSINVEWIDKIYINLRYIQHVNFSSDFWWRKMGSQIENGVRML